MTSCFIHLSLFTKGDHFKIADSVSGVDPGGGVGHHYHIICPCTRHQHTSLHCYIAKVTSTPSISCLCGAADSVGLLDVHHVAAPCFGLKSLKCVILFKRSTVEIFGRDT